MWDQLTVMIARFLRCDQLNQPDMADETYELCGEAYELLAEALDLDEPPCTAAELDAIIQSHT